MSKIKENAFETREGFKPDTPNSEARNNRKKKNKKKLIKRIISSVILVAILVAIGFGVNSLFTEEEIVQEALTATVMRGSIESLVTGQGYASPKASETITLTSSGTVLDVYVDEGDKVTEGQPLYDIDSEDAKASVEAKRDTVESYQDQLNNIYESYADLTVTAPFSGKMVEVAEIEYGDDVSSGTTLCRLIDDRTLKLELYFSYAYEHEIAVGKTAEVSIPSTMTLLTGTVEEINYVNRVTPEGSSLFAAIISVQNSGALTEGMGATATLMGSDGLEIYPYEAGELKNNRETEIMTKTSGEAVNVNLINYMDVSQGTVLISMSGEDNDDEISRIQTSLTDAQEELETAEKNLANFNAVAPMTGTVQSINIEPGEEVDSGSVAITISDNSIMTVEAKIDAMSITNVKAGMFCEIIQRGRDEDMYFSGIVESVSLEGKSEDGYSYFPAMIEVDNFDGLMMTGVGVEYSLIASQSDDTLLVPLQAVKYTIDGTACVFVDEMMAPENALDPEATGLDIPVGYVPVGVTVGLTDTFNAEILDGLDEGMMIFTQYMTASGGSYGGYYW